MPAFWRLFGISIVKINGYGVVWGRVGVAEREQENTPGATSLGVQAVNTCRDHTPFMTATLKVGTRQLFVEFLPIREPPCEHFEVLHVVPQVW